MFGRNKTYRFRLESGNSIVVEECGRGAPIIFLHGVLMSRAFFRPQIELLRKNHKVIAFDFPGHGVSDDPHTGHTVPHYARSLRELIQAKRYEDITLVGWSMGAFVAWQYLLDYGPDEISRVVIVDETPTDLKRDDYPLAPLDLDAVTGFMELFQNDMNSVAASLVTSMFKDAVSDAERRMMEDQILKVNSSTAGSIFFDQTMRDYRQYLGQLSSVAHLLCFGRDEKLISVDAAKDLHQRIPGSSLKIFEESGHCPFWEEPERFRAEIEHFIHAKR